MPEWIKIVGASGPFLLILSVAVAIFGIMRLKASLSKQNETKLDEEQQRREFLARMQPKIEKVKKSTH